MKILAAIEDPKVIRKILEHMGLDTKPPPLKSARGPPKVQHHFEDDFAQQHCNMNPQEHEVRTTSAGDFDNFNQSADLEIHLQWTRSFKILKNTLEKSNIRRQSYKSLKIIAKEPLQLHNFDNSREKPRC
jgi:hypothetical protein